MWRVFCFRTTAAFYFGSKAGSKRLAQSFGSTPLGPPVRNRPGPNDTHQVLSPHGIRAERRVQSVKFSEGGVMTRSLTCSAQALKGFVIPRHPGPIPSLMNHSPKEPMNNRIRARIVMQ